jgi:hypothetical protein
MCTLLGSVPVVVEYGTYWTRYFYRLNKLQQIENARVNLVKRECDLLLFFYRKYATSVLHYVVTMLARGFDHLRLRWNRRN